MCGDVWWCVMMCANMSLFLMLCDYCSDMWRVMRRCAIRCYDIIWYVRLYDHLSRYDDVWTYVTMFVFVRLCLMLWDDIIMCNYVSVRELMCTDEWRYVNICDDMWWCVSKCADLWSWIIICNDVCLFLLMCIGVRRCVMMRDDAWWYAMMFNEVCWCVCVCNNMWWDVIMCNDVRWC